MSRPVRWVVASANPGKLAELRMLLGSLQLELVSQSELGIAAAPETADTFIENALAKARHAAAASTLPAIADDSGLLVAALAGAPGVRSARFAGEHADADANNTKLLEALAGVPDGARGAEFYCVLVALEAPNDPAPLIASGRWSGSIADAARGRGGFGYDPLFVDAATGRTAAELSPAEKNAVSHRGRAIASLREQLGRRLPPGLYTGTAKHRE